MRTIILTFISLLIFVSSAFSQSTLEEVPLYNDSTVDVSIKNKIYKKDNDNFLVIVKEVYLDRPEFNNRIMKEKELFFEIKPDFTQFGQKGESITFEDESVIVSDLNYKPVWISINDITPDDLIYGIISFANEYTNSPDNEVEIYSPEQVFGR